MYPELFNIDFHGFLGLQQITFYSYAVCIVLGTLFASLYAKHEAKKKLQVNISNYFVYLLFIVGYVGGKVFLYLEKPLYYINNPSAILDTFSSGFVFYGSFIFIIPTAIWYFKKNKISILPMLDILAVSTAIIQIIGRTGCFLAGCCYGKPTNNTLGMVFPTTHGLEVHPTQLYESFLLVLVLLFLLNYKKYKQFNGQLFLFYLGFYAVGRFVLELYRGDSRGQVLEGVLSHSQTVAIILFLITIITYYKFSKRFNLNLKS